MDKEAAFNSEALRKQLDKVENNSPRFYMGVDATHPTQNSYCLTKTWDSGTKFDVILSKSVSDKDKFEEEVKNLCKYFNATLIEENE